MLKKILITGGAGQLGACLYSDFMKSYEVINTSRQGNSKSVDLDVANSLSVKGKLDKYNPDIIFNCASYNSVDGCESNREYARSIIVGGLENLVKHSDKDCKIVHISSDYIFNGNKGNYSELDSPDPINYYGKLKLEAENFLRASNRDFVILRCSVVFSEFLNNKNNFLGWIYNNLKEGRKIEIVDDQFSNPCPVQLLSESLSLIIALNLKGIFNVGSLDSISRYEFALKVCERFKLRESLIQKIKTNSLKQNATRPKNTYLNIDKISNELDIDIYSLDYYLDNIIEGNYE